MPRHSVTFGRAERLEAPRRTLAIAVLDQARRDVQSGTELGEDELASLRWWARRAGLSSSIVDHLADPQTDAA
jgi:hypothetical protein